MNVKFMAHGKCSINVTIVTGEQWMVMLEESREVSEEEKRQWKGSKTRYSEGPRGAGEETLSCIRRLKTLLVPQS